MHVKVKTPDGTELVSLTPGKIAEHFATERCKRYGWSTDSAAWYQLSNPRSMSREFMLLHTGEMYPGCSVELVHQEHESQKTLCQKTICRN